MGRHRKSLGAVQVLNGTYDISWDDEKNNPLTVPLPTSLAQIRRIPNPPQKDGCPIQ